MKKMLFLCLFIMGCEYAPEQLLTKTNESSSHMQILEDTVNCTNECCVWDVYDEIDNDVLICQEVWCCHTQTSTWHLESIKCQDPIWAYP